MVIAHCHDAAARCAGPCPGPTGSLAHADGPRHPALRRIIPSHTDTSAHSCSQCPHKLAYSPKTPAAPESCRALSRSWSFASSPKLCWLTVKPTALDTLSTYALDQT